MPGFVSALMFAFSGLFLFVKACHFFPLMYILSYCPQLFVWFWHILLAKKSIFFQAFESVTALPLSKTSKRSRDANWLDFLDELGEESCRLFQFWHQSPLAGRRKYSATCANKTYWMARVRNGPLFSHSSFYGRFFGTFLRLRWVFMWNLNFIKSASFLKPSHACDSVLFRSGRSYNLLSEFVIAPVKWPYYFWATTMIYRAPYTRFPVFAAFWFSACILTQHFMKKSN